jgi:hypothetical protein
MHAAQRIPQLVDVTVAGGPVVALPTTYSSCCAARCRWNSLADPSTQEKTMSMSTLTWWGRTSNMPTTVRHDLP